MRHFRQLPLFIAAFVVGSGMIAGTAYAQAPAGYYVAVPAAPPTRSTLVTRETPWTLKGNAYVAARAPERDAALCQAVARSTGVLSSFTVAGQAYDADALAKCNAKAKGGAAATVAAAR